eukprot:g6584.t1
MQAAQYWKPGEKKPRDGDVGPEKPSKRGEGGDGSSRRDSSKDSSRDNSRDSRGEGRGKKKGDRRGDRGAERRHGNSGDYGSKRDGSAKKRGKKSEGSGSGINASVSRSAAKPPVTGPSQGLLAMKFMQRKVKSDEAQRQQQEKRDKLESDFNSSYLKRLKPDKPDDKDRLICRVDEQDPALVMVGRRSFGGFNAVAEAAYDACVRDIAAGERLGQLRREGRGGGGGISDAEMAKTLGKNMRSGNRR